MVEVAVIVTISTVLILLALTAVSRWILPKVLYEEDHDEEHDENPSERPSTQPPA